MALSSRHITLLLFVALIFFTCQAHAFGAGNIASISAVEGKNWRHGDIEDVLKQVACIRHHKWTSMMIKRVYFGNWLRDYSQAMDTGALKKAQPETIRILVWLLSFLGFGYATAEFEVTSERLGVYRPEEHIDNPKDYNDNDDARSFDARLRGPVRPVELDVDMETGMKNYIANGKGDWATSAAYVKYSFERSIHHGRLYTNGNGLFKGKDEDLAEALRCLGQGLHTLEDFGAHTNYVELVLRDLGHQNVFAHTGTATMINLHGKQVYPLITGTFGMVDFYHSVLGEATDHFTQSEVNEMDNALGTAQTAAQSSNPVFTLIKLLSKVPGTRDLCEEAEKLQNMSQAQTRANHEAGGWGGFRGVDDYSGASRDPNDWSSSQPSQPSWNSGPQHNYPSAPPNYDMNQWNQGPQQYQQQPNDWSQHQPQFNQQQNPQSFNMQNQFPGAQHQWQDPQQQQHQQQSPPQQQQQMPPNQPGILPQATPSQPLQQPVAGVTGLPDLQNFDAAKFVSQIYPILAFRDKVVRRISAVIEKIPGLEALVERITETLTVFILSLLAPFVRPVLNAISKTLQTGSEGVVSSSGKHQYEVWTNAHSTDPTHSMLSKDHFSNLLNEPAGFVAAEIVKFIAPRVLYAWEHPDVPVPQVMGDVETIFHHPSIRNERHEVHRNMFEAVRKWVNSLNDRGSSLNTVLSSESVRAGKNHKAGVNPHTATHHNPSPQPQHQFAGYNIPSGISNFIPGGGQHHQNTNSPFGMVGNLMNTFTPQHHHQQQQQQGGFNEILNLANKLPIPGLHKFTGEINKFSSFIPGGRRGIDDTEGYSGSSYATEIGGTREFDDAIMNTDYTQMIEQGQRRERSPSPPPMRAPEGYEMY